MPKTKNSIKPEALPPPFPCQDHLRVILETAVDAIVTIDQAGTIISFNRAATKMFGYETEEAVGRNVRLLMPSPYREEHDSHIKRYIKTGKPHIIGTGREIVGQRRNGEIFPMELSVSEVRHGDQRQFVGIIRDITERKNHEKALVKVSESERREIGQDLHDALGQIITGISLLAKSLAKKLSQTNKELAADAEAIATLSMNAMTETKRLAYGAFPTELELQGLQTALKQLLETTRRLHHIEIDFRADGKWERLETATELHLYRIAQESVANAIKHGDPKHLEIILERDRDCARMSVRDDGSGFSPKKDPDTIHMGLHIMRHRAMLVGGELTIRSRKKSGTEVSCCIPSVILVSKKAD
jgi:two-component system CheB/CheR fusion protein